MVMILGIIINFNFEFCVITNLNLKSGYQKKKFHIIFSKPIIVSIWFINCFKLLKYITNICMRFK